VKVMAIDPGGVTGWATFCIPAAPDKTRVTWAQELRQNFPSYGQLQGEHHLALWQLLRKHKPDVLVYERYEKRNNDFSLLVSCEYIGIVKAYAQESGCYLVEQGASQALVFVDTEKLEKLDLCIRPYTPNKDANAARKHLVYYLLFGPGRLPLVERHLMNLFR
jgi:hypothetical protein